MQLVFSVVDHYRVTGVVSPLIAGDNFRRLRDEVRNLAFPFVTPLCSDHNNR
jgi:hypothetical protein